WKLSTIVLRDDNARNPRKASLDPTIVSYETIVRIRQSEHPMTDLWENPMGTDGFEFVEYTAPDVKELHALFERMGFRAVAHHRSKAVTLYRQGGVNFIVNAEPDSHGSRFAKAHGPSACAMAFRVQNAGAAFKTLVAR